MLGPQGVRAILGIALLFTTAIPLEKLMEFMGVPDEVADKLTKPVLTLVGWILGPTLRW